MLYILKSLPDLVRLILLVVTAYRGLSKELDRASTRKKIENAIKNAKNGNTSELEDLVNKRM